MLCCSKEIFGILKIHLFCFLSRLVLLATWSCVAFGLDPSVSSKTIVKNLKLKIAENHQFEEDERAFCLCQRHLLLQWGVFHFNWLKSVLWYLACISAMVHGILSENPIEVYCLFIGWCSWNCFRLDIVLLLCEIFDFDNKMQTDEIQLLIYAQIS